MNEAAVQNLVPALALGLLGASHCWGMCGGIIGALTLRLDGGPWRRLAIIGAYNAGRIASYGAIGALLGGAVGTLPSAGLPLARTFAGLLLIAMGLYMGHWWRGIARLERLGHGLWRYLKPLGDPFLPPGGPLQALLVGAIWGWLPCGLVYSALAYASTQAHAGAAAAVMVAFGLGTLPAVLLGGLAVDSLRRWMQRPAVRVIFASLYIAFGVWTIGAAWHHLYSHGGAHTGNTAHEHHH